MSSSTKKESESFLGGTISSKYRSIISEASKGGIVSEETKKQLQELYGASAEEWLRRWDEGQDIWSIEMSGLGPGHEQAIQVATAELVRIILNNGYECKKWANPDDPTDWNRDRKLIYEQAMKTPTIESLGLVGAQYGAALFLAAKLCIDGPAKILTYPETKNRIIQVSKNFPFCK
jgi:hypothetical protein